MMLTRKQKEVLDFVESYRREHGYAPTLREIGEALGLSSVATVYQHLKHLEAKGLIRREGGRARQMETTSLPEQPRAQNVRLLGLVAAGSPIEALEQPESMALPEDLLGRGETFVLRVKGDSMIEDHILDGDFIVVEKREHAQNGEIVVALIEHEATVKRFYREAGQIRLQPANAAMRPIYVPEEQLRIQGIVIGVLRKMGKR
ncbi:MAG: transcriptional repressor LexA [candidate division FCPU426 bacterium]